MRSLFRNIYFWVAAGITLAVIIFAAVFIFPPLIGQVRSNHAKIKQLESEVAANEQFLSTIKSLEKQKTTLDTLHEKAILSLPTTPSPEILLLQLDGLLKSMNLTKMTIDVPLSATTDKKDAAKAKTVYSLTGPATFDQAKELIVKLRTLSRWNKLTQVSITKAGEEVKLIISGEAFSKPVDAKAFSGAPNLLTDAAKFFEAFEAYTTVPDVTTEGSFGKTDPFGN